MTSIRRHLRLASLALAAAAGTQAGAGDEGEWEHPFAGVLPEPDGFASVNPPDEGVELTRHVAGSRIIDFETGKPLPGATLSFFPEDASAAATSYVKSAAAGTADVTGLAAFEFPDRRQRAHWVADAPGKAPSFQFGPRPASIVALHNGAPVKGRLVDPLGRAVEGVPIDAYGGTSHAPTVRTTRTMKDGTFALPSLAPAAFAWCATAPAGTCRVPAGEKTLGRRAPDFVLATGSTVHGRFLDAKGAPLAGIVVRGTDFDRSPLSVSDAKGDFELPGLPGADALRFQVPQATAEQVAGARRGPRMCVLQLGADGALLVPDRDAHVVIRVKDATGRPVGRESIRLTRITDGWSDVVTTADDSGSSAGAAIADVPAGAYEAAPATAFEPATFAIAKLDAAKGPNPERTIAATAQPSLSVRGSVPPGAKISLAVEGGESSPDGAVGAWHPHLPAAGTAVLRVQPFDDQRVTFFIPVAAVAGTERRADVAVPAPHRISITGGFPEVRVESLTCDGLDVAHDDDGPAILTYAEGPMVLDVRLRFEVRRFSFEVGTGKSGEVILDPAQGRLLDKADSVKVTYSLADGKVPADVQCRVQTRDSSIQGSSETVVEAVPPCFVTLALAGHQTMKLFFAGPAATKLVWGTCALHLKVIDPAGAAAPSIVQIDDVLHWTNGGALDIAGLDPGAHRVVVWPVRAELAGRELRIVLRDGEQRSREVKVPNR